ncbi:hypothetical protein, conserved [Eimeria acervulina]|uniref:Uncharacterized protein n=1 Tax=Eimeria acervulina TaxID=5801 RepID=U6GK26_EIMAC|nr:hypothetical protein, conserved [Eimeria acervulina]CDI79633.1 hypothetical protein, conserved [Eimeria acervulina]
MLQGEKLPPYPYTPLNVIARQSLTGFDPSAVRRRTKQGISPQILAVSAGLVAAVCSAIAFVVLQCARKVLFPRLFGSLGRRALSNPDVEENWVGACIQEEEEEIEGEAGEAAARAEGRPSEEAGETRALEALEGLRCTMSLGVQTLSCLPSHHQAFLLVLLFTICAQELVVYGVYSTPSVELERQKTMDFILSEGKRALAHLDAVTPAGRILELLERFRDPQPEWSARCLAVEATISAYRIIQCKKALQQLQPWVKKSTPIPQAVCNRAFSVIAYTRQAGKARLKADVSTSSWVERMQAQLGFFGIFGPNYGEKYFFCPRSFEKEMMRLEIRFKRFERALAKNIRVALSRQPLEQNLEEQRQPQYQEQQQQHNIPQLCEQQHLPTCQHSEHSTTPSSVLQHFEQRATGRTDVVVQSSHPSWPLPTPFEGPSPAPDPSLVKSPLLQSTPPPKDPYQHNPTPYPGPWDQPSRFSVSFWQKMQHKTKDPQQSLSNCFTSKSVPFRQAPAFALGERPRTVAQMRVPSLSSVAMDSWQAFPSPRKFDSLWLLGAPSLQRPFALSDSQPMLSERQSGYLKTFPVPAPSGENCSPLYHSPKFHQPPPRAVFATPSSPQPTQGLSLQFQTPAFHRPISQTPRDVASPLAPLPLSSGYWQQKTTSHVVDSADSSHIEGEGAQGGTSSHSMHEAGDLNAIASRIAEAFPVAGRLGPVGAQRARRGEQVWFPIPSRHPAPPHGDGWETFPVEGRSMPLSSCSQGASSAAEATPQTQMGALWSLWGDSKDGSR